MTHGDDKGLILPPKIAPIQVVIIPIYYTNDDKDSVIQKAHQIKDDLSKIKICAFILMIENSLLQVSSSMIGK